MKRRLLQSAACFLLGLAAPTTIALTADELLHQSEPGLYALYKRYPQYHEVFQMYARMQKFSRPLEQLGTVVHELIHVDSLVHSGFFVEGVYYEPYLRSTAWPQLSNEQLAQHLKSEEKNSRVFWDYVLKTPKNHLGNALDELNAHTHVVPWVCQHEPASKEIQSNNLNGFLLLVNSYLRVLEEHYESQYHELLQAVESRGALTLLVSRALSARTKCATPVPDDLPNISAFLDHTYDYVHRP